MEMHWNRFRVLETRVLKGLYRHPSMQIILTLSPEVCKCYLHWAISNPSYVLIRPPGVEGLGEQYGSISGENRWQKTKDHLSRGCPPTNASKLNPIVPLK